jgi:FkbM family methyltransferase
VFLGALGGEKTLMQKFLLNIAAFAARILPTSIKQAIYKNKPLAGFIRDRLNRAAPSGLTMVKVAAGDLTGYTILLDMQIDKDYWLGTYEPELQAALRELIQPGAVIYDVGANIGYVSLLLAKAAGANGHVYAFEALPGNAEQWLKNVALNGMEARLSLYAGAVTNCAGPVRFLVHASGGMGKAAGSAGRADQYQSEISVPGISLDEFVYSQGNQLPQVVKMDIEGGEVLALPGMRRVLAEARPLIADGTARAGIQPGGLGYTDGGWVYDLLDAARLPAGAFAGGNGLEGVYRGKTQRI